MNFPRNMNENMDKKKIWTDDFADTCQCACYPKIWDSKKNL